MTATRSTSGDPGETSAAFKRRFMARLVVFLTGSMFLDGYVLGITDPVTRPMGADLHLSPLWQGLVGAGALIGIFFGAVVGGRAADQIGRKPLLAADMALFVIASAAHLVADSPGQLVTVRLVMGLAIGVQYSVGAPLLSEFSPARSRGRLLGLMLVAWYVGFLVAYIVGHLLIGAGLGWRATLASSIVIALALLVVQVGLPESPRWLWTRGRTDAALAVSRRYLTGDVTDVQQEDARPGTVGMLFSRRYWRVTLFTSLFWFCAVTPYFAIATFADTVLAQYGLSGGFAGGIALNGLAVVAVVIMFLLIDKVGRRPLIVPTQWLCTAFLVIIGLWPGAPPALVLALFLGFAFLSAMYGALTNIYPAEVFPTEIRAIGTGFGVAFSRIGAASGTFLLPWSMATLGSTATMLIAAGIAVVGAGLSQWLAPETNGKRLTEAAAGIA